MTRSNQNSVQTLPINWLENFYWFVAMLIGSCVAALILQLDMVKTSANASPILVICLVAIIPYGILVLTTNQVASELVPMIGLLLYKMVEVWINREIAGSLPTMFEQLVPYSIVVGLVIALLFIRRNWYSLKASNVKQLSQAGMVTLFMLLLASGSDAILLVGVMNSTPTSYVWTAVYFAAFAPIVAGTCLLVALWFLLSQKDPTTDEPESAFG